MNFLSTRDLSLSESVQSVSKIRFHLRTLTGARKKELMKTHLCRMDSRAQVLELCPIDGWPEKEIGPVDEHLICNGCGKCAHCA